MEIHTPTNRNRKKIQFTHTHISPDVKSRLLSSPRSNSSANKSTKEYEKTNIRQLNFDEDSEINISSKLSIILKYLLVALSIIAIGLTLYITIINLTQFLEESQLQRDRQYAIRILKEQKGKHNCSEDTESKYVNIDFIEEKVGKTIKELFNDTFEDDFITINYATKTMEYIGDDFIIPLSCSIKRSLINFLNYYRIIIISTVSVILIIIYGWIKYKIYMKNKLLIQDMFNECIEILKSCSHSSNEGYIAEDHIKVEVANTKLKRSLWDKVVDMITKDTRVRVTPRQVSGETMTSWKWVSTLHHNVN